MRGLWKRLGFDFMDAVIWVYCCFLAILLILLFILLLIG
ncbi:hypothetical protein HNQ42_001832 [Rummeliibacillus stabekisii]|nr:hypothetical protein [Rummeliibacillus stabekisii]